MRHLKPHNNVHAADWLDVSGVGQRKSTLEEVPKEAPICPKSD